MNNFNKVFAAIKEYCADGKMAGDCFAVMSEKTGIAQDKPGFYLDTLQDLGLIKHSLEERNISLTIGGQIKNKLFM